MKIFTSSTACSFFFHFFFIGPWIFVLDYSWPNNEVEWLLTFFRLPSIFAPSLAISFSSPSPYGNREFLYPMCVDPHAHPHACFLRTQAGSLKYTYVRMRGSQSWRDREKKRDFLGLFYGSRGRENKVLPNVGKHGVVFARPVKRSVFGWYHTNLCVHTHTHKNVCLCAWFDVCEGWHRRSRVFLPRGDCHLCVVTIIKHIPLTFSTRYRSNPRKFIDISRILSSCIIISSNIIIYLPANNIVYIIYKRIFYLIIKRFLPKRE